MITEAAAKRNAVAECILASLGASEVREFGRRNCLEFARDTIAHSEHVGSAAVADGARQVLRMGYIDKAEYEYLVNGTPPPA